MSFFQVHSKVYLSSIKRPKQKETVASITIISQSYSTKTLTTKNAKIKDNKAQ